MGTCEVAKKTNDRRLHDDDSSETRPANLRNLLGQKVKSSSTAAITITNHMVITGDNCAIPIAEEYRKLKCQVLNLAQKRQLPYTLMVSSCVSNEGKSITALNLALCLAQEFDKPVLLVDADLRNPSVSGFLGLEPKQGLINCLRDGMDLQQALIHTGLGNLALLPVGERVPNPVELFSSQRMKELLYQMRNCYSDGFIVFDTSPALLFSEARTLGHLVDGVVLVVREGGVSSSNISEVLTSFKDTTIVGFVYNMATTSNLEDGHYYNYYHDYYSRRQGKDMQANAAKRGFFSGLIQWGRGRLC